MQKYYKKTASEGNTELDQDVGGFRPHNSSLQSHVGGKSRGPACKSKTKLQVDGENEELDRKKPLKVHNEYSRQTTFL